MSASVTVVGTGTATAAPDVVTLDTRIQCDGDDVASTLEDASARMAAIQEAARGKGIAATDLQTSGAGVHPRWGGGDQPSVIGYSAYQTLRIRVRDRDQVGPLISELSRLAGNTLAIDNISLAIADPAPLLVTARERAFADARAKAEQYAALAGRELGAVREITDMPTGGGGPVPVAGRMAKMDFAAAGAEMGVEAGEHAVSSSVMVRWGWAD